MKRFSRYYRDPEFRAQVDQQFAIAKAATRPGFWITYAIHDPRKPDHIMARPEGLIVYVGQTKDLAKRVPKRMRSAGSAMARPTDRIDGLLYEIMANGGPAPRWSVLEEVSTAIDSLVSETNWARHLRMLGYPISNQWAEHKGDGFITRADVPTDRMWKFTCADAIGSGLHVIVTNPDTGEEAPIDLAAFPLTAQIEKIKMHARANGMSARIEVGNADALKGTSHD